jgi:hypothetical protein
MQGDTYRQDNTSPTDITTAVGHMFSPPHCWLASTALRPRSNNVVGLFLLSVFTAVDARTICRDVCLFGECPLLQITRFVKRHPTAKPLEARDVRAPRRDEIAIRRTWTKRHE